MRPCDRVAKRPLPCVLYGSFKMFIISAPDFLIVSMRKCLQASTDEFLAAVSEVVIHSVYKVVSQPSFSVT